MENIENKNKNLWIGLGVVLVIVVGIIIWSMSNANPAVAPTVEEDTTTPLTEPIPQEDKSTSGVNNSPTASTLSYANALIKYKDARIQLDNNCQATPHNLTFKNGTNIMIDNRASVARIVKVGSIFTIKGYGFKIVKLSSATLPATWLVDCGKSQNVATILIQK